MSLFYTKMKASKLLIDQQIPEELPTNSKNSLVFILGSAGHPSLLAFIQGSPCQAHYSSL